MSQAKSTWRENLTAWRAERMAIGISEVLYIAGLACLFLGVWIWLGIGQAFATLGITLITTAIMNGMLMETRAAKNVV